MGCHYPSPTSNDPPKRQIFATSPKMVGTLGPFFKSETLGKNPRSSGLSSVFPSKKLLFWNV